MATKGRKLTGLKVEVELVSGTWTRLDQNIVDRVQWSLGIAGNGPLDRIADTGTCSFTIGKMIQCYIPNRTGALAGWGHGTPLRITAVHGNDSQRMWTGNVRNIQPPSGRRGSRLVHVSGVDWMARADRKVLPPLKADKRGDEILTVALGLLSTDEQPPGGTDFDQGSENYPYALHEARTGIILRTLFSRVARNELGLIFVKRDGTLAYRKRTLVGATSVATFDETRTPDDGLQVASDLEDVYSEVRLTIHPLKVDPPHQKQTVFELDEPIELAASSTITLHLPFRNRDELTETIGAANLNTPTFSANSQPDGSGTDRTSFVTVVVTASAGSAEAVITNSRTGYVVLTSLVLKGQGVYDLRPFTVIRTATDPKYERSLTYDLPWQDVPEVAEAIGDEILRRYGATARAHSLQVIGAKSVATLTDLLSLEVGDVITVTDEMSGTAALLQVLGFDVTCTPALILEARLQIGPITISDYFTLGASEVGGPDVLG